MTFSHLNWGATYQVRSDLHVGNKITVDYTHVAPFVWFGVTLVKLSGLNFAGGGPSAFPWNDSPFTGSSGSGGTAIHDPSTPIHNFLTTPANWGGLAAVTDAAADSFTWTRPVVAPEQGGMSGPGGHVGWVFANRPGDTEQLIQVTATSSRYGWTETTILNSGITVGGIVGSASGLGTNILTVTLTANVLAPNGIVIVPFSFDNNGSPTDADEWPNSVTDDAGGSPSNRAFGRALSSIRGVATGGVLHLETSG